MEETSAGSDPPIAEAFAEIIHVAERLGVKRLCDLPGCWEVDLGDGWRFALNGHKTATPCTWGATVPPYHAIVEYGEMPVLLVGPGGGSWIGSADAEDDFIAALREFPNEKGGAT